MDPGQVPAQAAQVGGELLGGAGDIELVPRLGDEGAVRDDDLVPPLGSAEQHCTPPLKEAGQGYPYNMVTVLDHHPDHLYFSSEKGVHIRGGGKTQQMGNL